MVTLSCASILPCSYGLGDSLNHSVAPRRLLFGTFLEEAVDFPVHIPARGVCGAPARRFCNPPKRVELETDVLDFVALEPAHCAVTALNDAVGQPLHLVRQNVAGDRGEPVVIVR